MNMNGNKTSRRAINIIDKGMYLNILTVDNQNESSVTFNLTKRKRTLWKHAKIGLEI